MEEGGEGDKMPQPQKLSGETEREIKKNIEQLMNGDSIECHDLKELQGGGHAITWQVIPGRELSTHKALNQGAWHL